MQYLCNCVQVYFLPCVVCLLIYYDTFLFVYLCSVYFCAYVLNCVIGYFLMCVLMFLCSCLLVFLCTPLTAHSVRCQVSQVTSHLFFLFFIFPDKLVELVGGGSVINGAYPVQFIYKPIKMITSSFLQVQHLQLAQDSIWLNVLNIVMKIR